MHHDRRTRRGGLRRALVIATLLALAGSLPAQADLCGNCPEPAESNLAGTPGFALQERATVMGGTRRDYFEVDAGACRARVDDVTVEKKNWRLEVKATGEALHCPHAKQDSTIVVQISQSDSTSWSVSATAGASATLLGVGLTAQITAELDQRLGVERTTTVSQKLQAAWCHRVPWTAFLEKADLEAEARITVLRVFSWWTKNTTTGHVVHRSGTKEMPCGSHTFVFSCLAPLSVYIHHCQRGCPQAECLAIPTGEVGFFPQLPQGLEPPEGWEPAYPAALPDRPWPLAR